MKLLIDLSILRHPYCGLGQLALGYGDYYAAHPALFPSGWEVTLLVPKGWVGRFGPQVSYLVQRDAYRLAPWLMPRFDVWHSIHQLSPFRPSGRGTRRILTIHDVNFVYEKQGAKRRRYLRRLQHEVDYASEVCFISRFAMQDTLRFIDLRGKSPRVVYSGAASVVGAPQRRPEGIDTSRPFLLSVGVLKEKKNVHTLIPMMEHLPEYGLVMAGGGSGAYADRLREDAAANPRVCLTGFVSDEERNWLYAHCAGFLFPSLFEGFGRPVIEAMQWGKPVFCSTCTSIPEFGAEHAFYFNSFDAEAMAAVVRGGMAQFTPERQAAEQAYADTFGYDRHMEQYLSLYSPSSVE